MTNHVHLLMTTQQDHAISDLMQYLGRLTARRFNYICARCGSLFEDRFKSGLVQENESLLSCLRYIELNLVKTGMVTDPGYYRWSSYSVHGFGKNIPMWTPRPLYLSFGRDLHARREKYRQLISQRLK